MADDRAIETLCERAAGALAKAREIVDPYKVKILGELEPEVLEAEHPEIVVDSSGKRSLVVTRHKNVESERVGTVKHGGRVIVAKVERDRARIMAPVEGWVSQVTTDRATRLEPVPISRTESRRRRTRAKPDESVKEELFGAIVLDNAERMEWLIKNAAIHVNHFYHVKKLVYSPLHWSAVHDAHTCVRALLRLKADVNLQVPLGAFELDSLDKLEKAVQSSIRERAFDQASDQLMSSINARKKHGETALHLAASFNSARVAPMLIKAGALLHITANSDMTPVNTARSAGSAEVLKMLQVAADKEALLLQAAVAGDIKKLRALLDQGVNVNCYEAEGGNTALHVAAYHNSRVAVSLLVEAKANVAAKDFDNNYAEDDAAEAGHTELAAWLKSKRPKKEVYASWGEREYLLASLRITREKVLTSIQLKNKIKGKVDKMHEDADKSLSGSFYHVM